MVVPLHTAPFLLYLPIIFLVALALGQGPGAVPTLVSALAAASFFTGPEKGWRLSGPQDISPVEFFIVCGAMPLVCTAVRKVILDNEVTLQDLSRSHAALNEREATLALAKEEAEAAEAANRARSTFLADMSHELRTPLSAVIGYSEMMEEEVEDLCEVGLSEDLRKIKSNAKHLLSLINDGLDLSKIEANRMGTFAEDIDVPEFLKKVATTVGSLAQQRNNMLVAEAGDGVGAMHTDLVKVRQCLFNLLSNASKFTKGGRITLAVERFGEGSEAQLEFRVGDTGIGMTDEQLGRMFQRFSQAGETTTRKFGGTGLGLAIARAFSRLLGGNIAVSSVHGRGTTFRLRLPAYMPERGMEGEGEEAVAPVRTQEDARQTVLMFSARDLSAADRARLRETDGIVSKTARLGELTGQLRGLVPPVKVEG